MQQKQDYRFLDVLRWIATVTVVLYHVFNAKVHYVEVSHLQSLGFSLVRDFRSFCVPLFIMISGGLLLRKDKSIDYSTLFSKYVRRIVLVLIIFGYPMALMEELFTTRKLSAAMFLHGARAVLTGEIWSHMWYLYMLIGLYLVTPMLKHMLRDMSKKDVFYALLILFVFTSVFPEIESFFGLHIGVYLPVVKVYLFYYLAGYFFLNEFDTERFGAGAYCALMIICCIIMIIKEVLNVGGIITYGSPISVILTVSIFCLAKRMQWHSELLSKTKYLCFGVYLTHMVFINFAYKFLKLSPFSMSMFITGPLYTLVFLVLSIAASYVLNLIPPLKKYVL